uniref:Uncharacterized protein n=1 Tax=Taeniopygia guttata TaxID=59729 RepID=H0YUM9_TAEGU
SWNGLGGKGIKRSPSATPAMAGTPPTVPGCSSPSVQPFLGHSRDPGAAPAALAIPAQPGIPHSQDPIHDPLSQEPLSQEPLPQGPLSQGTLPQEPLPQGPSPQGPLPQGPLSQVPLSQVPLSQGPLSQVPLSQVPLSQGPLSQVPLSQGPLSQVPLSQGPLSQVPLSQGPLSQGPLSQGPLSQGPLSQGPLSQDPLSQENPTHTGNKPHNYGKQRATITIPKLPRLTYPCRARMTVFSRESLVYLLSRWKRYSSSQRQVTSMEFPQSLTVWLLEKSSFFLGERLLRAGSAALLCWCRNGSTFPTKGAAGALLGPAPGFSLGFGDVLGSSGMGEA